MIVLNSFSFKWECWLGLGRNILEHVLWALLLYYKKKIVAISDKFFYSIFLAHWVILNSGYIIAKQKSLQLIRCFPLEVASVQCFSLTFETSSECHLASLAFLSPHNPTYDPKRCNPQFYKMELLLLVWRVQQTPYQLPKYLLYYFQVPKHMLFLGYTDLEVGKIRFDHGLGLGACL